MLLVCHHQQSLSSSLCRRRSPDVGASQQLSYSDEGLVPGLASMPEAEVHLPPKPFSITAQLKIKVYF
jgi:hypothetical protein